YFPEGSLQIGDNSGATGAFIAKWVIIGAGTSVNHQSILGQPIDYSGYGQDDEDSDGDGIPDGEDACPADPNHDAVGDPCQHDEDGDGFDDFSDACPTEPGTNNGCPASDSDGDGTPDNQDQCPTDPNHDTVGDPCQHDDDWDNFDDWSDQCPREWGLLEGCRDDDGDGFRDTNGDDHCPADPGPINGCRDSDGDGTADRDDICPYEPVHDTVGNPCIPDEDYDGVPDVSDACPNEWGDDPSGCPSWKSNNTESGNEGGDGSGRGGGRRN
ncbi:MAG TPA: thrombospondin type 3 repeat-containing protein, partial [Aggregatilineales bacterium]|nr:thrombospondin type 3 repeat-containing protein [Aggregatilineales bacterium]